MQSNLSGVDMADSGESPMGTLDDQQEKRKSFTGQSPCAARDAASLWLRDFTIHGPLDIRSISVSEEDEAFVATVTYAEASVEITPRHFPEKPQHANAA